MENIPFRVTRLETDPDQEPRPARPEIIPRTPHPERPPNEPPEIPPQKAEPELIPDPTLPEITPQKPPEILPYRESLHWNKAGCVKSPGEIYPNQPPA